MIYKKYTVRSQKVLFLGNHFKYTQQSRSEVLKVINSEYFFLRISNTLNVAPNSVITYPILVIVLSNSL